MIAMEGSYDRRVVTTHRVEYVISTPYGAPIEAKTLGVVLANVNRELGDRVQYDDAYQVRGEDGQVVISFETEEIERGMESPLTPGAVMQLAIKNPPHGEEATLSGHILRVEQASGPRFMLEVTAEQVVEAVREMRLPVQLPAPD